MKVENHFGVFHTQGAWRELTKFTYMDDSVTANTRVLNSGLDDITGGGTRRAVLLAFLEQAIVRLNCDYQGIPQMTGCSETPYRKNEVHPTDYGFEYHFQFKAPPTSRIAVFKDESPLEVDGVQIYLHAIALPEHLKVTHFRAPDGFGYSARGDEWDYDLQREKKLHREARHKLVNFSHDNHLDRV